MFLLKQKILFWFIFALLFIMSFTVISGENIVSFPPDGTSSKYSWDFNDFPNIWVINNTHIDFNDNLTEFEVKNPTFAEFNVTYMTFGDYLEEIIKGMMYNSTYQFKYLSSYLINKSNRHYVNELGDESSQSANGYIDPTNVSIGMHIDVGGTVTEVTAKENIKITGTQREAWKLMFISEFLNLTFYYDSFTGLLIDATLVIDEGSIGGIIIEKNNSSQIHFGEAEKALVSHKQTLISTNAWDSSTKISTTTSGWDIFILLVTFVILPLFTRFYTRK